jgi:PTH1 family peptidyl-tRNA hydrolase
LAKLFAIVGLGNPGQKYAETRHNAGFWFLDRLASQSGAAFRLQSKFHAETVKTLLHGQECILVKPSTFVNNSGQAVRAVLDYFDVPIERLLIAYDELDLAPGVARLKLGGGHGGHNGLRDIFRHTKNQDFMRLRIGIGHPGSKELVTPYVLSRPRRDELDLIGHAIAVADSVMGDVLSGKLAAAQTRLHTTEDAG